MSATAAVITDRHSQQLEWTNPRLRGRLLEVDGLRGVAILMVLTYHYVTAISAPHHPIWRLVTSACSLFWSGVDLFFVLSGFLIAGILMEVKSSGSYFRTFYLRRAHRIFPLYFGWLLLLFIGTTFNADGHFGTRLFSPEVPIWAYSLFVQNNIPLLLNKELPLWMAMSWSLALEEQFYLLLPALVRNSSRTTLGLVCGLTVLASPVYRFLLVSHNPNLNAGWPFSTMCRLDGLALGVAVAIAARNERCWQWARQHIPLLRICAVISGVCVAAMTHLPLGPVGLVASRFTLLGAFYSFLLILVLIDPESRFCDLLRSRMLIYFGTVSYAIYIFHQGTRGILNVIIPAFNPNLLRSMLLLLVSAVATILMAHISWHVMEKKLVRRAHRRYRY
jgi:peptidoglycan/LPS O-acetylase OafA/YrhL